MCDTPFDRAAPVRFFPALPAHTMPSPPKKNNAFLAPPLLQRYGGGGGACGGGADEAALGGGGGQRAFDGGKDAYKKAHAGAPGRHTRHILANNLLELYGADPEKYALVAEGINYRMGGRELNLSKDKKVDNGVLRAVFQGGVYDAQHIASGEHPVTLQQQRALLH